MSEIARKEKECDLRLIRLITLNCHLSAWVSCIRQIYPSLRSRSHTQWTEAQAKKRKREIDSKMMRLDKSCEISSHTSLCFVNANGHQSLVTWMKIGKCQQDVKEFTLHSRSSFVHVVKQATENWPDYIVFVFEYHPRHLVGQNWDSKYIECGHTSTSKVNCRMMGDQNEQSIASTCARCSKNIPHEHRYSLSNWN